MTARHVRADNLGSLLRPAAVRAAYDEGTASERRAVEDAAIAEAITHQERVGLPVITDGEFRRRHFFSTLLEVTEGLDPDGFVRRHRDEDGNWHEVRTPAPVRRLERTSTMADAELAFVRERTSRQVKITLPAPSLLSCYWSEAVSGGAYPTREEYLDHLVELTAEDVRALVEAGVDHVQLDAPHYCYLNIIRPDIEDADAGLREMVRRDQEVFAGVESQLASAIHVCRGNNRSRFVGTDPYDAFAPALFPELTVDRVLLEYDDARAGGFEALKLLPENVTAVLGLITSKHGDMEERDELHARIEDAARHIPLDRLALSTQCGFASDADGNEIGEEAQWAKLELVVDTAEEVWGALVP
jgi:5-methyltetrahydropteroyltriglutamate--homocysteine methyltransferase